MLVAPLSDPLLRIAVGHAARVDEDVVFDTDGARVALQQGFPRLLLIADEDAVTAERPGSRSAGGVPVLRLSEALRASWERARRADDVPAPRAEYWGRRLRTSIAERALRSTWIDGVLRDLSRSVGAPLPHPFRGLARRVLEHPARYHDLHDLAALTGLSRGALKARFRRRGLPSPYAYVRWLRILAAAHVLAEASVTTLDASVRLGFTSNGNFSRAVRSTTGLTPGALRQAAAGERLLVAFSAGHLARPMLDAWEDLGELFLRRAA